MLRILGYDVGLVQRQFINLPTLAQVGREFAKLHKLARQASSYTRDVIYTLEGNFDAYEVLILMNMTIWMKFAKLCMKKCF